MELGAPGRKKKDLFQNSGRTMFHSVGPGYKVRVGSREVHMYRQTDFGVFYHLQQ